MEGELTMSSQSSNYLSKLYKKYFDRNLAEIISEGFKVLKGILTKHKFDSCGSLLRVEGKLKILKKNAKINIGNKVKFCNGVKISAWGNEYKSIINIGDNTWIGDRTEIHAGKSVDIGANCNISWDVCIMDRDYHKFNSEKEEIEPIKIGDNVWICCNSLILKGIKIGDGSVIAAGSVVTKDVPANVLAGGNPAKILKESIYWNP